MFSKQKVFYHSEYPFKSNFIDINGHKMHFIDEGTGDKTVLLIHSGFGWSYFYRKLIRRLSGDCRVIAPDLVGYGLSEKPRDFDYRIEDHVSCIEQFVEALKLKNVTLVTHGWGTTFGFGYATQHYGNIRRLVVLDGVTFIVPLVFGFWLLGRIYLVGFALTRLSNLFLKHFMNKHAKDLAAETKANYLFPYDSYDNRIAIQKFIQDIPVARWHCSWMTILHIQRRIHFLKQLPVYIVWGRKSKLFGKGVHSKWRKYLPQAKYAKFTNSHFFMLEKPESDAFKYVKDVILERQ